ncbi:flocculin [Gracilaria domingensis]|nr:flocculin [Gracilaria domingensis]
MGNEVSEMAADAIVSASVEEGNPDMDALAEIAEESFTCGNGDELIESLLPDDEDVDGYTYYDEDVDNEGGGWEAGAPIEEEPVSEAYSEDVDNEGGGWESVAPVEEEAVSEAYNEDDEYYDTEDDSNDSAEGNAGEEESGDEYAADLDDWDGVEIGEIEDGLFDEDIYGLRSEAGLFGEVGLDIYDGVDPMEPIDWEVEEFYDYDVDELSTATDIELTSLGYPPEPIAGTTTEDIIFSAEMMDEYTVPLERFNEGASKLLETQEEMVDSIRDMR